MARDKLVVVFMFLVRLLQEVGDILWGCFKLRVILNPVVVHKGHEYLFGVFFIGEYVSFHKFDAFVMNADFDLEIAT